MNISTIFHLLITCYFVQAEVPYKPEAEFTVNFSLSFSKRGESNRTDLVLSQTASSTYDRPDNSPLPFLKATLEVIKKSPEEVKLKIVQGDVRTVKKKIEEGKKVEVFAAFVDDIKDQIVNYNHTIFFLNKDGDPVSKVVIEFDEEGFYSVNGKKKGKL